MFTFYLVRNPEYYYLHIDPEWGHINWDEPRKATLYATKTEAEHDAMFAYDCNLIRTYDFTVEPWIATSL